MTWLLATQRGQRIFLNTAHIAALRDHGDRTIFVLAGTERTGMRELWTEAPFEDVARALRELDESYDLTRPRMPRPRPGR